MTGRWIEPQGWPELAASEVHVWLADLRLLGARAAEFSGFLSPEERDRAARFRIPEHRERSQATRGLLRLLLAHYAKCDAHDLAFTYNAHGKPAAPDAQVQFNVSHSGDYAAFAFTPAWAVGVDVERIQGNMAQREEIARRYFAPGEVERVRSAAEDERASVFFNLWTCKEAFVKARGDGLFSGLDRFEISSREPRVVAVNNQPAKNWWLATFPEVPGYAGAVVVNAPSCSPRFWKFPAALK